jgi:DNA-binding Lrp family transcriptional regulator
MDVDILSMVCAVSVGVKIPHREMEILEELDSNGKLTNWELQERLKVSKERIVEHRKRDKVAREKDEIANNGVLLSNDWNRQNRRSVEHAVNETSYQNQLNCQRDYDVNQKVKENKKKSGATRCLRACTQTTS